jgi:endonuclease-3
MATIINKPKIVTQLLATQTKAARAAGTTPVRPVLEQFIYAVLREDTTRAAADRAYSNLQDSYFDWNEVRVSSEQELTEALAGLSDAESRGRRIREFLQEVFETTFSFDLEPLQKKGVKQAAKQLSRFAAANDYVVAFVVQHSLDGHSMPLDSSSTRVLKRLGLIDEHETNNEALRGSLEHQVPKAKGSAFIDLVSELAESVCWEEDPSCSSCALHHNCVYGSQQRPTSVPSKKPR